MLKQSVAYTDFDDNESVETLYFNLTKTELADNLDLKEEFEKLQSEFIGDNKRELESQEIRKILELVKTLMRLSYGVRSADGKRFVKTQEQWTEFTQTAVYDQFLFSLFEQPTNAMNFITGILPKELRSAALEAAQKSGVDSELVDKAQAAIARQNEKAAATLVQNVDLPSDRPPLSDPPTMEEINALTTWMANNP